MNIKLKKKYTQLLIKTRDDIVCNQESNETKHKL